MNRRIILSRRALGVLLSCMLGVSFFAQAQKNFTAVEIASLPQYCQDRFSGDKDRIDRWRSTFEHDNLIHIHHFCYGLVYFSRASREIDSQRRSVAVKLGIRQFDYVMNVWPANFSLYQQAQVYKQQLEMMRKWN